MICRPAVGDQGRAVSRERAGAGMEGEVGRGRLSLRIDSKMLCDQMRGGQRTRRAMI